MLVNFVVAASENNVIGKDNKLLWHLPNDMAFFKNTTWGMPVIMGRKTFESMDEPLKGRTNIVITRQPSLETATGKPGVTITSSVAEAIAAAEATDAKESYIIGGGEIFRQAMPLASRIYLTRVHATLDGDAYFPELDPGEWQLIHSTSFGADDRHAFSYTFEIWQRK